MSLETERLPLKLLCEGTWRGDFFTVEPGEYVEKDMETAISLHSGSARENGKGILYRGL
jgi:hypothetical protein